MPLIRHPSRSRFRFRSPVYGLGTALLVICGLNMPVQAKTPHSALSSGQDISLAQNTSVAQNTPIAQTPIPPKIDHVFTEAPTDHILGADDAPHTIISYASVTCGHCGEWFTHEWPSIKTDLIETGRIRFVFREFPTQPVQLAMAGFYIANCAGDNTQFFKAIEYQMENQTKIRDAAQAGEAQALFLDMAKMFGIKDVAALNACFRDESHYKRIDKSVSRGTAADVTGTPFFFINGDVYKGGQSHEDFVKAIDALDKSGVSTFDKSAPFNTQKP